MESRWVGERESGGRVREEATLNSISKFAINFGVWLVCIF